jgi:hypothetical protein
MALPGTAAAEKRKWTSMTIQKGALRACALLVLLAPPGPISAQSGSATIDCSSSHAMMAHLMNPSNGPFTSMPGAGIDRNYGSAQMQIAKLQANLAKIELACGTDAKAKAAAQRALDEANAMEAEINAMLHTN